MKHKNAWLLVIFMFLLAGCAPKVFISEERTPYSAVRTIGGRSEVTFWQEEHPHVQAVSQLCLHYLETSFSRDYSQLSTAEADGLVAEFFSTDKDSPGLTDYVTSQVAVEFLESSIEQIIFTIGAGAKAGLPVGAIGEVMVHVRYTKADPGWLTPRNIKLAETVKLRLDLNAVYKDDVWKLASMNINYPVE